MKRTFTSTFTAIAIGAAAVGGMTVMPAMAAEKEKAPMNRAATQNDNSQCLADLGKTRDELAQDERFRSAYNAGRFGVRDYRDLVSAAQVFARNGMEERCQTVVAGIKDLAAKSSEADAAEKKPADVKAQEQRRAEEQKIWMTRYNAAKPIAEADISVETLTGADVRNGKGEDLGEVTDIIVAGGKVEAVIIGRGGFLGMGISHYRIKAANARIATMDENDAGDFVLVIDMDEKQFESQPKVTKENGRWMAASDEKTEDTKPKKAEDMKDEDMKDKKAD